MSVTILEAPAGPSHDRYGNPIYRHGLGGGNHAGAQSGVGSGQSSVQSSGGTSLACQGNPPGQSAQCTQAHIGVAVQHFSAYLYYGCTTLCMTVVCLLIVKWMRDNTKTHYLVSAVMLGVSYAMVLTNQLAGTMAAKPVVTVNELGVPHVYCDPACALAAEVREFTQYAFLGVSVICALTVACLLGKWHKERGDIRFLTSAILLSVSYLIMAFLFFSYGS